MIRNPVHIIQRQKELREIDNPIVEGDVMEENTYSAVLSRFPLTLNTLWNEYEFGLANRKAPKDFTAIELGIVK